MPDGDLDHIPLLRTEPVNERRRRPGFPAEIPQDVRKHANDLLEQTQIASEQARETVGGFDPSLLLRLRVVSVTATDLEAIPGLRVVSEEEGNAVVVFASQQGLTEFTDRLNAIAMGGRAPREDVLLSVLAVDNWTAADRMGWALRSEGWPRSPEFLLDIELWDLDLGRDRGSMIERFEEWCGATGIGIRDRITNSPVAVLYRVTATRDTADMLLNHRDVRRVDLPPKYQLEFDLVRVPLEGLSGPEPPATGAPGVVVLDSGLATGHPLLAPAIGDAQSFVTGVGEADDTGHGTMVGGLALYGDVQEAIRQQRFVARVRLFSGKIYTPNDDSHLVESRLQAAVEYFVENYNCRVFVLTLADVRKPFQGGHVGPLAATVDWLSQQFGVVFVVASGNVPPGPDHRRYPACMLSDSWKLLDPAPAVSALTVGSLARHEVSRMGARYRDDPAYQPIARRNQPSPFSRTGLGPRDMIKPDVVHYGGNLLLDVRTGHIGSGVDLGEISTSAGFAGGNLFAAESGTSFAAPRVAHLAARLLERYPAASSNLIKALVLAHAKRPNAVDQLFGGDEDAALQVTGLGLPDEEALASTENRVTLVAEDEIAEDYHHFYEIPLPLDFFAGASRRPRRVTVALAHTPGVRRTRSTYMMSAFSFRVVRQASLETVVRTFRRLARDEHEPGLSEYGEFNPGPNKRDPGASQGATWWIKQVDRRWLGQHLYVVVTRSVPNWARGLLPREPYALAVVLQDPTRADVRYHTQIQQMLRVRVRV